MWSRQARNNNRNLVSLSGIYKNMCLRNVDEFIILIGVTAS